MSFYCSECRAEYPWIADFLNRRTAVESVLRKAAKERRPIDPDEARDLANRLSIPSEHQQSARPS